MREIIPAWMKPIYDTFHYAPAILDGEHLWSAGMIGARPDLSVPRDPTEQFTLAFKNLRGLLAEAELTFADITEMITHHIGLREHLPAFGAVKRQFVSAPHPAWTAVGIVELAVPGALVEIQVTAGTR